MIQVSATSGCSPLKNNPMKYIIRISIVFILLLSFRVSAQDNLRYCPYHIKELLIQFDKYTNFKEDASLKNVSSLFYYDESSFGREKIIPNIFTEWFGDDGNEMLTMSEFAEKYKKYFGNKELKYDTLLNDRIAREYNMLGYKIYVVKVTKEVRYLDKGEGKRLRAWEVKQVSKDANLYFSIISVKTKNKTIVNKIARITTTIPDYDWYTPQQVGISFTPAETWLSSDSLSTSADFGFKFKAHANYTLTGKNYFNLILSPGIGISQFNFKTEISSLTDIIPDAVDYDGYPYRKHILGDNLKQDFRINYLEIPVDLAYQWYIKSFRIRAITGLTVGLKTSSSIRSDFGTVEYYGEYNFGTEENPWIVNLYDLPDKYGFSTYDAGSIKDYSYISPVSLSGNLGAMVGYSPDKRIDFNLGVYATFGLNNLNKSSRPAHLTEKDGELYPLIYADDKSKLNSAGLYFSVSYNLQDPNIPYSKKINRELVNNMKTSQLGMAAPIYEVKRDTYKEKIPIYINGSQGVKLNSVKCIYTGLNKGDNFKKNLKLKSKPNNLKISFPTSEELAHDITLSIQKPFSYNITRVNEDVQNDQISDELTLTGDELLASKGDLKLMVTPIPDYFVFYVDRYQVMEDPQTAQIQSNMYSQIRNDINNAEAKNGKGLLYFSLGAPIFYHSFDSTDVFLQKVSQSQYELSGTRLEDFNRALADNNVDLSRRKLHIYIYLASYNSYEEFIKKFLLEDLLKMKETVNNWANIDVTIYLPLNLSPTEREKHLFTGDKLPVLISNWRLINIL
jgi:hypothetical protein